MVACNRGPSDEFCDAAEDLVVATSEAPEAEPGADGYAQLDATIAEILTILERMENETEDELVLADLKVIKEGFETYQETGEAEAVLSEEAEGAGDDLEDFIEQNCEGVEIPDEGEGENAP